MSPNADVTTLAGHEVRSRRPSTFPGYGVGFGEPASPVYTKYCGEKVANSVAKRAIDITLSALALLLFLPLLLLIAVAIRLESEGPALFRQRRGGLNGVPFHIFKFRTMRVLEDGETVNQATRGDQRLTRLGIFLRKTSLDELPQLINILRGEMCLVGPRPHALAHDKFYSSRVARYSERLKVRPGLTGLAQISGCRGEVQDIKAMAARVELDLAYIDNWSTAFDLKLMILTVLRGLFDGNAY